MSGKKQVAIVTGAGSGIGRVVSVALAQVNFQVVLSGRRLETLRGTIEQAGEHGRDMHAIAADTTSTTSVSSLFADVKSKYGRLDLLFNNAGINIPCSPIEDVSYEDWQKVVATNLTGVFLCTQEAIRIMKEQDPQGGRIINNGSISAHVPRPGSIAYTATKHAVSGLTKSTGLDCRKYNIACGQIDIGNAETSMISKVRDGVTQADGSIRVEPMINPEQVARAVVYMAELPLDANVPFMTIMATRMPYMGRG